MLSHVALSRYFIWYVNRLNQEGKNKIPRSVKIESKVIYIYNPVAVPIFTRKVPGVGVGLFAHSLSGSVCYQVFQSLPVC